MKNTFSNIIKFMQKDLVFIIAVGLACMLYPFMQSASIMLCAVLLLFLLANIQDNKLFYTYFALIFFEPVINLPIVGGTFFRVFYLLLALRVVLDFINKRKIKRDIPTIIIGFIFVVTTVLYSISTSRAISVMLNSLSVLYIVLSIKNSDDYKKEIGRLLTFIAVFSALSGVCGLIRDFSERGRILGSFFGIIDDPNYSALFFTIGFFASFGANMITKKWAKISLQVFLGVLVLLTSSITAMLIVGLLCAIWFLVVNGWKKTLILVLAFAILVLALWFIPFDPNGTVIKTQNKLKRFVMFENPYEEFNYQFPNYSEFELYLNRITSKRYYLAKTYAIHLFVNTPLQQQFFGGNNPVEGDFKDNIPVANHDVSHNTYIDMMFMIGYVFLFVLLMFIGINIIRHFKKYLKNKDIEYICLVLIMLTVLLYATSISIFPFRYFIAFLLL